MLALTLGKKYWKRDVKVPFLCKISINIGEEQRQMAEEKGIVVQETRKCTKINFRDLRVLSTCKCLNSV